jgi:hypothetical protein
MHLPEFVLSVAATVAAIAAGFAVVASNYNVARVLFWIATLSFGSLGIVWSATSQDPLSTQLLVSAIVGAVAAAGLTWGLWELRSKEANTQKTENAAPGPQAQPANPPRPWLEATRDSEINAKGAVIAGEFPNIGQFAKLDDRSKLDMSGVMIIGQNAPTQFPLPTGALSSLSNSQVREEAKKIVKGLLSFEKEFDDQLVDTTWKTSKTMDERQVKMEQNKALFGKYAEKYGQGTLPSAALSIVSEMLSRTGPVDVVGAPQKAQMGSQVIMQKRFAGSEPAASAASFIEYLAQKLPN